MPLTPEEIEAERERFEAAFPDFARYKGLRRHSDGKYVFIGPQYAFRGWLAAVEAARERAMSQQDAAEALLAMQGWPEMKHVQENGE